MTADSLIWAAKRGDLVALETAIRSGANVNSEDSQGWTALFHAAHHGNTKALQLLIDAGADVNRGRESGFTALFSAVGGGHVEVDVGMDERQRVAVPGEVAVLRSAAARQGRGQPEPLFHRVVLHPTIEGDGDRLVGRDIGRLAARRDAHDARRVERARAGE